MNPKRLLTALLVLILGVGSFVLLTKPVTSPIEPIETAQITGTPTPPESEVDEITQLLTSLQEFATVDLSPINPVDFDWRIEGSTVDQIPSTEDIAISGKGFEAVAMSSQAVFKIYTFFEDQGFQLDAYNAAAGTVSGLDGWKKGRLVCLVAQGVTGYKEATGQWIPPETDKTDMEIKCGFLPDPEGDLINAIVGGEFTIRLEANATTGYSWEVEYDEEYLELTDQDYETEASPGIVGAGGQEIFTFQVLAVGETEITFSYSRPWEEEILETRIFEVTID